MANKSFRNGIEYADSIIGRKEDLVDAWRHDEVAKAFDAGRGGLRDHFAGLAMQGLQANPRVDIDLEGRTHEETMQIIAKSAHCLADAMIAHRDK